MGAEFMVRGFAIIEVPLAFLTLGALIGVIMLLSGVVGRGEMIAVAWLGVALVVPFVSALVWLIATRDRSDIVARGRSVDDAGGGRDA